MFLTLHRSPTKINDIPINYEYTLLLNKVEIGSCWISPKWHYKKGKYLFNFQIYNEFRGNCFSKHFCKLITEKEYKSTIYLRCRSTLAKIYEAGGFKIIEINPYSEIVTMEYKNK